MENQLISMLNNSLKFCTKMSPPDHIKFESIFLVWLSLPLWHINHYGLFNAKSCLYIYIYIYHHHHHHVVLVARISLTLSHPFSLSFIASGRSSGLHPVSSHSCWMYVRAARTAFAWPYVGVHKSTSLISSSLLLQQCPNNILNDPEHSLQLNSFKYCHLIRIIRFYNYFIYFWRSVKWFQVFLFSTNNFIQHCSFVSTQLKGSKYCYV